MTGTTHGGAAPANIIPRFIAGVRPSQPGFDTILIAPQPGRLRQVSATVPTRHGPVHVTIEQAARTRRKLRVETPATTLFDLSAIAGPGTSVKINGRDAALDIGQRCNPLPAGCYECEVVYR